MIERIYNIILWRLYSFLRGGTKLLNGINPFTWLLQIPIIKKFYIKRGSSVEQIEAAVDYVTNDPVLGSNIWFANKFMMLTLFFWLLNFTIPLLNLIRRGPWEPLVPIIWIADVLLVFLAQWCFAWQKDKYLKYFKKFEKQPQSWKIKWGIISFLFVITPIILLFIG